MRETYTFAYPITYYNQLNTFNHTNMEVDVNDPVNENGTQPSGSSTIGDYDMTCEEEETVNVHLPNLNPLLNDLILAQIMQMMAKNELLKCRQVCTMWNSRIVPLLQRKIILEFGCHRRNLVVNVSRLNSFADRMRDSQSDVIPFRKFSLIGLHIDSDTDYFFQICGPTLKHLNLKLTDSNRLTIPKLKELFWNKLPTLESLVLHPLNPKILSQKIFTTDISKLPNIRCIAFYQSQDSKIYSAFYADLFAATINLTEIQVKENILADEVPTYCRISASVLVALQEKGNLKHLHIMEFFSLSEGHVRLLTALSRLGLALSKLKVYHLIGDLKNETFNEFLLSQKDSLLYLTLGGLKKKRDHDPMHISFPRGMVLRSLKLTGIWGRDPVPCYPINYSNSTPRLQNLRIGGSLSSEKLDTYFPPLTNIIPCIMLTTLNLPHSSNDSLFPARVAKMFPNVKKLKIHCPNSDFLTEIWKAWPRLEELKIVTAYGCSNLDAGITGISHEDCLQIEINGFYQEGILERYRTEASICDLKNLRKLVCIIRNVGTVHDRRIPNIITDLSAYFALRHLNQIRHLSITGYHVIHSETVVDTLEISNDQRQLIFQSLRHAYVSFGPHPNEVTFEEESATDEDLSDSE